MNTEDRRVRDLGKTYFNSGITGNGRMLATFTDKGELNRVFWPSQDYYQHINNFFVGIKFDDSNVKFLNDNLWYVEQSYQKNSTVLDTSYTNSDFGLNILQSDFILMEESVLVRTYKIKNISDRKLNISTFVYSEFVNDNGNMRNSYFDFSDDFVMVYNKEFCTAIGSNIEVNGFQLGESPKQAVIEDRLYGKDNISMTSEVGMKWILGELEPNETKDFNLYICFDKNRQKAKSLFNNVKKEPINMLLNNTKELYKTYTEQYSRPSTCVEKIDNLYEKTLLVFFLFANKDFGGIIASPEVDENFSRCGRYGYCWPRDAIFITKAFDICKMHKESEKFYSKWAKETQLEDGSWQQRYFVDGSLAPAWGLQIDETASMIYGVLDHYKMTKNRGFLEDMWGTVKKAAMFLIENIDEETALPLPSYDLWEERIGEHAYTAAAVYGALNDACEICKELDVDIPIGELFKSKADKIKEGIECNLWSNNDDRFLRGIKTRLNWWNTDTVEIEVNKKGYKMATAAVDNTVDISLLGLSVPFGVLDAKDERIRKTARAIEDHLDGFPSGGYGRYEYDSYIGGNPWPISTLWLALYYSEIGDKNRAKDLFNWAINHTTNLGFLPEQIDKFTGEPAWVMQLAWSHAMFIIVLDKLSE